MPPAFSENENEHDEHGIAQWYTSQCIMSRQNRAREENEICSGDIVELRRPTASGTYRVMVDSIAGHMVMYSYGVGLLSEGVCSLSTIKRRILPPAHL